MHPMHKVSAVMLAAVLAIAPATGFAAVTASLVNGTKADALPVASMVTMIGTWNDSYLGALDKATSIKVYDTKVLYTGADQQKIASAITTNQAQLDKVRAAIRGNADLAAWFTTNKLDVNRVIGVANPNGTAEIFLN